MAKPVHLLQRGVAVEEIVNSATIAAVDTQESSVSQSARAAEAVAKSRIRSAKKAGQR